MEAAFGGGAPPPEGGGSPAQPPEESKYDANQLAMLHAAMMVRCDPQLLLESIY